MGLVDHTIAALRPLRFRGKNRLLGWLLPDKGIREAHVFGYRVELDLGDFIQRMVYLGCYERHETDLVARYLRRGMTFVDAGANIGYYTFLAARLIGASGRVFAFEPSPYAVDRLERTVRENGLDQVRVVRAGLSSHAGDGRLAIPLPGNHTPSMLGLNGSSGVSVALTTLDRCLSEWNIESVDLLKIDVEGFEPYVLAGASQALAEKRIRAVLCEFNDYWLHQAGTDSRTLYDFLVRQGFADKCGMRPSLTGTVCTRLLVQSA